MKFLNLLFMPLVDLLEVLIPVQAGISVSGGPLGVHLASHLGSIWQALVWGPFIGVG